MLQSELDASEAAAHTNAANYAATATRLRKREDDLVLLLQSYEHLRDDHTALSARVREAQDGGATHAARLQAELDRVTTAASIKAADAAELQLRADGAREKLAMRERQLALVVTHLEAGKAEVDALRSRGSVEEQRLRGMLVRCAREPDPANAMRAVLRCAPRRTPATPPRRPRRSAAPQRLSRRDASHATTPAAPRRLAAPLPRPGTRLPPDCRRLRLTAGGVRAEQTERERDRARISLAELYTTLALAPTLTARHGSRSISYLVLLPCLCSFRKSSSLQEY